jgi:[acyl-carrier-protein] S-malonyltransferase
MDQKTTAFLFPGQGSQEVGMGFVLAEVYFEAKRVFDLADKVLGVPISRIAWEGPESILNDTVNTQPALLANSSAALQVFRSQFPEFIPKFVAGHSMGEISALEAGGALPLENAFQLARQRGKLMKRAGQISPGGMAAILALDIPTMEAICQEASQETENVQVANDNCPGQVVISGHEVALERAMALAKEAKARKVVRLAVSIAAHSPLMADAQTDFNHAVELAPISDPIIPIIGNVNARPLYKADEIRADLRAQLNSRVRWTETIRYMLEQGVDTFIEFGCGDVLIGLVKRINRKTNRISLGNPEDFQKLLVSSH